MVNVDGRSVDRTGRRTEVKCWFLRSARFYFETERIKQTTYGTQRRPYWRLKETYNKPLIDNNYFKSGGTRRGRQSHKINLKNEWIDITAVPVHKWTFGLFIRKIVPNRRQSTRRTTDGRISKISVSILSVYAHDAHDLCGSNYAVLLRRRDVRGR